MRRRLRDVLAAAAVAGGALLWSAAFGLQPYRVFARPDGAYRVVVLRQKLLAMMPGQSGDAPGVAVLLDRDGRERGRVDVEMVQLVEDVDWSGNHASIKLIVDWPLP